MEGELKDLYGRQVTLMYTGTVRYDNKAFDIICKGEGVIIGITGQLLRDTDKFIVLGDAMAVGTNPLEVVPKGTNAAGRMEYENAGGQIRLKTTRAINKDSVLEVMVLEE